jgi:hypothetical protein
VAEHDSCHVTFTNSEVSADIVLITC